MDGMEAKLNDAITASFGTRPHCFAVTFAGCWLRCCDAHIGWLYRQAAVLLAAAAAAAAAWRRHEKVCAKGEGA